MNTKTTIWKQAKTFRHRKGMYGTIQEEINPNMKNRKNRTVIVVDVDI